MDMPQWHVNGAGIREETTLADTGTGIDYVYVVPYVIDSGPARGSTGVVRVVQEDFTPDEVKSRIETMVAAKHGIASLGSPVA